MVTVTSPYEYRVQYINLIHYNMKAKRISQKAVKNMINGNTALLHIGNFDTGKRTNLKRAVSECMYASRLYYNTEIQSDNEKNVGLLNINLMKPENFALVIEGRTVHTLPNKFETFCDYLKKFML